MRPRRTTACLAAVLVLGAATACTPDGDSPTPTVTSPAAGPVRLTLGVYGPASVISAYTGIAARFSAEHPSVAITVKPYADHAAAMADLEASRGTSREPDLFLADSDDVPMLEQEKLSQRVDGLLADQNIDFGDGYQRTSLEAFSDDNALQCMPVDISPMVVYYNSELVQLSKLRPPGASVPSADKGWRFEDFATAAQQASRGSVRGVYVAPTLEAIASFVFSGGGSIVDDTEKPTSTQLSSGSSSDALRQLLEVVRDPALTFSQEQLQRKDAVARFKSGQLGMMLGFRSLTPELRAQEGLHFGVMPIPRVSHSATVLDVSGLCMRQKTPHRTTAAEFLAYLVGDESSETLAQTGYVTPANTEAIHSDAFLQPAQDPSGSQVFDTQDRFSKVLPRGEKWQDTQAALNPMLTALFYDPVVDPLDARLDAIDEASKPLLEEPSPSPSPSSSPTS